MKLAPIALILFACFLITVGRAKIRRARQLDPAAARRRTSFLGWSLVLAGIAAMIAGVVTF